MKTHPFAEFIYSVEDTLGLWHKARKTEQTSKRPFDAHREHFQSVDPAKSDRDEYRPRLEKICRRLHVGSHLSLDILSNHVDILESVYIGLARQTNVVEAFADDINQFYIATILIPLICADILIFKEKADENSIYYHLNRILAIEGLVTLDGEQDKLRKRTARKYMIDYIDHYFTANREVLKVDYEKPASLILELLEYLDELPKKGNQTCVTLNQKIDVCNKLIFKKKIENFSIQPITAAYTAIIILQDIDTKTNMFGYFCKIYNAMSIQGDEDALKSSLHAALNENYNDIDINEFLACKYLSYEPKRLLSIKKKNNLDNIIYHALELCETRLPSNYLDMLAPFPTQELYLSKMVSLPPQFDIPMVISEDAIYSKYKTAAIDMNIIVFDKKSIFAMAELKHKTKNRVEIHYAQYTPLIDALNCIKLNNPDAALKIVENAVKKSYPLFGFIKYSLAVLYVGLIYKLERRKIKHQSLMQQVNDIINHQGIVFIPVIRPSHVTTSSNTSWLSEDDYIKYSIITGDNTYNAIILQAIYSYNFTVARHTSTDNNIIDANDSKILRVNLLDINYASSMICHDLLERFNLISGKILAGLDKVNTESTPELFVSDLISAHVILPEDLTDNLIHCIGGSSLGVCLLDHLSIILFLSVPGDDVENIIALGKNTKVVELLFRYQHSLTN
ncbi:hypothetical protein [Aeromonas salmonicida]|uniref:hypothetical protein n=1 Tax=Aeromonas salmonicida TaxID=645 RepID=UPI00232F2D04|nr:hypothetical protein [Aeromonas salmonicida]WCH23639.1 hypothetical protein ONZ54_04590 [Aeromonas salmonicida]